MHNFHSQCHYFAVAADMFNALRRQAKKLGLFAAVDFSEIDGFPWGAHKDVRNMRSHVTEYFGGKGHAIAIAGFSKRQTARPMRVRWSEHLLAAASIGSP